MLSNQTLSKFAFYLIPLIAFMMGPFAVGDLSIWVAMGLKSLELGKIASFDTFSVLQTSEVIYPSWLVSIIYAFIYKFFANSLVAVCLFHQVILLWVLTVVYKQGLSGIQWPLNVRTRLFIYLFWFGTMPAWTERPSFIAILPFLYAIPIIDKEDLKQHDFAALLLINIIWTNLHGSFPVLTLIYAFTIIMRKKWKYLGFVPALVASSLLNPFGYKIYQYVFDTITISRERGITEWNVVDGLFTTVSGLLFVSSVVGIIAALIRTRKWEILREPLVGLFLFSGIGIRNIVLPFFTLPYYARKYGLIKSEKTEDLKSVRNNFVLIALLLVLLFVSPIGKQLGLGGFLPGERRYVFDEYTVERAANYIQRSGRDCPIFNEWIYGSDLVLRVKNKIFLDTRNIIYSREDFSRYNKIINLATDPAPYLAQYGTCFAVLGRTLEPKLVRYFESNKEWRLVLEDRGMTLFEKIK